MMRTSHNWLALTQSRRLRLVTCGALYAAQGLPEGLLYVAVPAWLAQRGVEAGAIGAYIGLILLPWSLKLINGAIMDRWTILAMGRRRPWVIAAQVCLIAALLAFGLIPDAAANLAALTAIGVLVNICGAFQDVAVDGMAIDVFPESEHARANGVMWGSKVLGIAASAGVSGWLMSGFGLLTASWTIAAAIAAIMVLPVVFRERPGERILPWGAGLASPETIDRHLGNWKVILLSLLRAMLTARSLGVVAVTFVALASYGLFMAAMPVITVQNLGWADTDFTDIAATGGLLGGIFGILAGGQITDRLGARRTLLLALVLMVALHGAIAAMLSAWDGRTLVAGYIIAYKLLFVLMSVAIYAIAMRLSMRAVAATQFAVFMAFVNLGTSAGAALLGPLRDAFATPGLLATMAVLSALALIVVSRLAVPPPQG